MAARIAVAENIIKNITEMGKNIIETIEASKTAAVQTFMTVMVIDFPFLFIA